MSETQMTFEEHLDTIKKSVKIDLQVDYGKHEPTDNELNNICYMAFKYGAGHMMRAVDFHMVKTLGGSPEKVQNLTDQFLPALAEYLWDHVMGEPDDPTFDQVTEFVAFIRDMIYTMDETTRNAVDDIIEPDHSNN